MKKATVIMKINKKISCFCLDTKKKLLKDLGNQYLTLIPSHSLQPAQKKRDVKKMKKVTKAYEFSKEGNMKISAHSLIQFYFLVSA